jgi:hypothetical protein
MEIIITLNNIYIMKISSKCTPAIIYIIIGFIFLIVTAFKRFNMISTVVSLLLILLWTWILNYLCTNGYSIIAWLLLIFLSFGLLSAIQLF